LAFGGRLAAGECGTDPLLLLMHLLSGDLICAPETSTTAINASATTLVQDARDYP